MGTHNDTYQNYTEKGDPKNQNAHYNSAQRQHRQTPKSQYLYTDHTTAFTDLLGDSQAQDTGWEYIAVVKGGFHLVSEIADENVEWNAMRSGKLEPQTNEKARRIPKIPCWRCLMQELLVSLSIDISSV